MPNKLYTASETTISFKSSGGSAVFTPTSIANANGRISAVYDLGSGSRADRFRYMSRTRCAVNPTVNNVIRIYLLTSQDNTWEDGDFAAGDATFTSEDLVRNGDFIGAMTCDQASTTKDFIKSGILWELARYVRVAWWNASGQALSATAGDHEFQLTPNPPELQ